MADTARPPSLADLARLGMRAALGSYGVGLIVGTLLGASPLGMAVAAFAVVIHLAVVLVRRSAHVPAEPGRFVSLILVAALPGFLAALHPWPRLLPLRPISLTHVADLPRSGWTSATVPGARLDLKRAARGSVSTHRHGPISATAVGVRDASTPPDAPSPRWLCLPDNFPTPIASHLPIAEDGTLLGVILPKVAWHHDDACAEAAAAAGFLRGGAAPQWVEVASSPTEAVWVRMGSSLSGLALATLLWAGTLALAAWRRRS